MLQAALERYRLCAEERKRLEAKYRRIVDFNCTCLSLPSNVSPESELNTAGIYFWIVESNKHSYKLYIGQADLLSRRIKNYFAEFQPQSPNDFKIRFFLEFLNRVGNQDYCSKIALYALQCNEAKLSTRKGRTEVEKSEIKEWKPLINSLRKPTADERKKLKDAFAAYYRSLFVDS